MVDSKHLRDLILQQGFSQEDVARQANVSLNTVNRLCTAEETNPKIRTLKRIARVLNVPVTELIKDD